ncbi:MAG: CCA tRNA nucleotidyltransferase [Flavonifractor plautii]
MVCRILAHPRRRAGPCLDTLAAGRWTRGLPGGGCVRDLLLGRTPGDFDVCTDARRERVMELFPHTVPTGLRHGTVTVRTEDGPVEVTTFRREGGYADGRHHRTRWTSDATLAEDLARRDFTVNAMALDENGMVIDRYGGQTDLFRSVIRCVGDPDRRFAEDALRMLRAVRFAAQLGFSIEKGTLDAIRRSARRAENLSGERIKAELEKICSPPAGPGLLRLGLLALGGQTVPACWRSGRPPSECLWQERYCRLTGFPIAALPVGRPSAVWGAPPGGRGGARPGPLGELAAPGAGPGHRRSPAPPGRHIPVHRRQYPSAAAGPGQAELSRP